MRLVKNLHQLAYWCHIAPSSVNKWKGPPASPSLASLPPSLQSAGGCFGGWEGCATVIAWYHWDIYTFISPPLPSDTNE